MMQTECHDFVIKKCEEESHFNFFKRREFLWKSVKESDDLPSVVNFLTANFDRIKRKWNGKEDAFIQLQLDWHELLGSGDLFEKFCVVTFPHVLQTDQLHCQIIISAIGKYTFNFLCRDQHQNKESTNKPRKKQRTVTKPGPVQPPAQPDSGLQVLAGGVLGTMFKLYKKNRKQHLTKLKILAKLIVTSKNDAQIPIEQRARDRGGLYIMALNFTPVLRVLDHTI